jgi:hypothetical protein
MAVQRKPEQYGIIIDESKTRDFRITFDYSVSSGLSYEEARRLAAETMEAVGRQFEGNELLRKLTHYHLPLYLNHFSNSDPFLKRLTQKEMIRTSNPEKRLNRRSVPRIKHGLKLARINFDLVALQQSFAADDKRSLTANRQPVVVVFDPETSRISTIPPPALEVLALCDGKSNIKEIALKLSKVYDAPPDRIEGDVLALLGSLAEKGYLVG